MRARVIAGAFVLVAVAVAGVAVAQQGKSGFEPLPDQPPIPADNPMTPAKVELGKQLYFDPRLSINGTVSCNTCHDVFLGGTTNLPVALGVYGRVDGDRNDPTVWNAAFKTVQFWDGRAPSLEEQAKGPLFNRVEMGTKPATLVSRLQGIPGYVTQFTAVFAATKKAPGQPDESTVTVENTVKAIAAYERTLVTPNGPFDLYLKGKGEISDTAKKGMQTVQSLGCTGCHNGPNFTGPTQPMGKGDFQKFPTFTKNAYVKKYHLMADPGRYRVTHKPADKHMWVVQTWRNIELTAPYFHNGSVQELRTAVLVMGKTQLDKDVTGEQATEILAFFSTLTGMMPEQQMPRLPATPGTTPLMKYK